MIDQIEGRLRALFPAHREVRLSIALNPTMHGPGTWASPEDKALAEAQGLVWSCSWNISDSPVHVNMQKVYASSLDRLIDAIA